jgi:uncharacterized protein with GYD domain
MASYLVFGKYSAEGAKAVVEGGLTARKKAVEHFVTGLGMKQQGWWGIAEPDWDFVISVEGVYTPEVPAAQTFLAHSSGAFERMQVLTLVETEQVDSARVSLPGYQAPGH